jgi:hypothetical protein
MHRYKHEPWTVDLDTRELSFMDYIEYNEDVYTIKRTKKSAFRHAQKLANKFGKDVYVYKRNRVKHPNTIAYVVTPIEADHFLEML